MRATAKAFVGLLLFSGGLNTLALPRIARAHEPIFGVGPHTLFKNGVAVEVEARFAKDTFVNVYELAYGILADLTVTADVPLVYRSENGSSRFGVGDAGIRFKWRFLRLDSPGAQDSMAIVGGVKLPTGSSGFGTGSTDVLMALTYGHEGRRWYAWTDARYLLTTEGRGVNRGDLFFYDAALGIRPWLLTYEQPDLVLIAEVNGTHIGAARSGGINLPNTGGDFLTVGPALFFTYRNYALKGGVAFVVWQSLDGAQADVPIEGIVAFEGHF